MMINDVLHQQPQQLAEEPERRERLRGGRVQQPEEPSLRKEQPSFSENSSDQVR